MLITDLQEIVSIIKLLTIRSNTQPIATFRQFRYGAYHQPDVVKYIISFPISTPHILNLLRLVNNPILVS